MEKNLNETETANTLSEVKEKEIKVKTNSDSKLRTRGMMKAIQVSKRGGDFELVSIDIPKPKENEVLIKVKACGVCHGESVTKEGYFPGIKYPRIPGHEVIGTIAELGSRVDNWKVGQRAGVGWHAGHCFKCDACRRGDFWACENSLTTGVSTDGGYAEYMTAHAEVVVSIPDELDSFEAAPLVCAGRTSLGALQHSGVKGGDLVAIHGLGGLGHLAVQYASKLGFKTVVLSHSKEKEELAYKLGTHFYIDTNTSDPVKELRKMGGAQAIICFAPNAKVISGLLGGLKHNGKLVIVTAVNEPIAINANLLFGGTCISGFAHGNIEDTLRFSTLTKIIPMVEVFPLEQAALAYNKMMTSKVHFRAVLKMNN